MDELLLVRAVECRPLRETILRPGQKPEAWTYATDDDAQALHFAVKTAKGLVQGVASVLPEARPDGAHEVWRLRGMAVLAERRGAGLGRMLLQAVQAVVQQRGGSLWCTARTDVEGFYALHGFHREGGVFDIPGGGPHVVMTWSGAGKRMKPVPRRGPPGAPSKAGRATDGDDDLAVDEDEAADLDLDVEDVEDGADADAEAGVDELADLDLDPPDDTDQDADDPATGEGDPDDSPPPGAGPPRGGSKRPKSR